MSIYLGNTEIGQIYLGNTEISEAYLGANLVFSGGGSPTPVQPYDAQIEYLQSSGTQYIDTGISGSTITRFVIKGTCDSNEYNTNKQFIGGTNSSNSTLFGCRRADNAKYWFCRNASKTSLGVPTNISIIDATINSTTSQTGTLEDTITGTTYTFESFADSWAFGAENLLIFGGASNRISTDSRCYFLQLYTSNGLVRDFIPVRVGSTGYMYDRVSGQLFGNSGTGNFTLGGDIVPVEYLQSSGTQRIHTGITGNTRFTGSAQTSTIKGSSQLVICGRADGTGACYFGEAGSTQKWSVGTTEGISTIAPTTKVSFDLTFDNSGAFGTIGTDSVTRSANTTKNEWSIFASTNGSYSLSGRVYYLKIYQNDVLVRDFIPVRVGQVGYMYDKVSGQLFGNSGTGSFGLGNDKN